MELVLQLGLPLFRELWRAQDRHTRYLAPVDQLARYQTGFDGLADTHIISDQNAHRLKLERHEQGHELVGPRFNSDISKRAKWSGA